MKTQGESTKLKKLKAKKPKEAEGTKLADFSTFQNSTVAVVKKMFVQLLADERKALKAQYCRQATSTEEQDCGGEEDLTEQIEQSDTVKRLQEQLI